MPTPFAESPEFARLLRGEAGVDLTRIALEVARDAYPGLDGAAYLGKIGDLADRVRPRCPAGAGVRHVLGQINWVLFVEEGFRGNADDYYDPRNSYLNEVIDRKAGIPISLSVLYLALADRLGLAMAGVNLPAHFLVRTGRGESAIFVDPFHGGAFLDRLGCRRRVEEVTGQAVALSDEELGPCPVATIVARMLRNLKAIYLRKHDFAAALPILRRLTALAPDEPLERRDLGIVSLHAGLPGEAIVHLQSYLDAHSLADDTETITTFLRAAHRDLASRN